MLQIRLRMSNFILRKIDVEELVKMASLFHATFAKRLCLIMLMDNFFALIVQFSK